METASTPLFDRFVGEGEQRQPNVEADRGCFFAP
jgi:hypothetical protein